MAKEDDDNSYLSKFWQIEIHNIFATYKCVCKIKKKKIWQKKIDVALKCFKSLCLIGWMPFAVYQLSQYKT